MRKSKVFVGMSGGVDSSVSAALLKKDGYDITGVFIKTWSPEWLKPAQTLGGGCTWQEERRDAMRVTAKLKIPLITLDLEKEYKDEVVDYMIAEYRAGRVPNPDVMCNKIIKFGGFFDFAMKQGADFVATGHYACRFGPRLFVSADKEKDQTYFLWTLTQRELSRTLFPIGHLQKSEVRKLAKKFGLPNADKKDSQGLCFMGKIDVKDFLRHYIKEKKGAVLNTLGEEIGHHDGVTFYTLGERHGFVIDKKGSNDAPYYVVGKDIKKNILTVSNKPNSLGVSKKEIMIKDVNWNNLDTKCPSGHLVSKKLEARIRYRQELQKCVVKKVRDSLYKVIFDNSQLAAAGQSVVFYDDEVCLGGGVIL